MKYDVFISYRRLEGNGLAMARLIDTQIDRSVWYRSFLDFNELKDRNWHPQLLEAIDSVPVFLFVMTEGSLDRCVDENDCVRQELLRAIEKKKHIVPVNIEGKVKWENIDEKIRKGIPEEIRAALFDMQQSEINLGQLFKPSIRKLIKERISPHVPRVILLKKFVYSLLVILGVSVALSAGIIIRNHNVFKDDFARYDECLRSARELMSKDRTRESEEVVNLLDEADSIYNVYRSSLYYERFFNNDEFDLLIDEIFVLHEAKANYMYDRFLNDSTYTDPAAYHIDLALRLKETDELSTKRKVIMNFKK